VERQRQAEEAERQRLAEEAAQRAEEEKKAREAAIRLEEELKRKAEEEELQRRAEEAKKQAEDKRRAQQAALELERQRQEEEAEQQRQAELQRTRNLALQKMSGRELEQHLQRMAAWKTTSQRARELAAKRALEEAKAKIDKLLEESSNSAAGKLLQGEAGEQGAIPITAPGDGLATESITTSASERSSPELPAAEPLPIEAEDAMEGPTSIDPSSATGSIPAKQTQLGTSPDGSLADGELDSEIEPSFLQRLERLIKAPPSNRRDPVLKKKYNFNR
jgi:colicin import membrane protein